MPVQETLGLVIPTMREAECLPAVLRQTHAVLSDLRIPFEILVVDDDSRDGTAELVAAIARHAPQVRLLTRKRARGLAGAILHGWQHTDATLLGVMDADMQHPPALLATMVAEIAKGSDLVLASRYACGGRMQGWRPLRRFISAVSIWMTLPLQRGKMRVRDPMSGYFVVRRCCVENVLFRPTGFKLLLEILVRGRVRSVSEVPFAFGRRTAGRSKASPKVAWDFVRLLASLYRCRWKHPSLVGDVSAD